MENASGTEGSLNIRVVDIKDVERVVELSRQLGYPVSRDSVESSFHQIQNSKNHIVFVAEHADGVVIAWIQAGIRQILISGKEAEIEGLVVDENHRRRGIGHSMVKHAERWAEEQGTQIIRVRSNIIREEAHHFYKKIGYHRIKTQEIYRKNLS